MAAFSVDNELCAVVDPVDDAHRRLEDGVRVRGDRNHRTERHLRVRHREIGALGVLDVAERLRDGRVDVGGRVVRA